MNDNLKLQNQLCHRFYTVSNAFSRAYRPLLSQLGITYPQYVVMMALWEQDGIAINELLKRTHIDGGAMSLILKKLQAKGLISVIEGKKDKRSRYVYLSEAGAEAREQAADIPQQMRCQFEKLNSEEIKQLYTLIDKLSDNLQEILCARQSPSGS
ncbi:MarR family transcriptional regulator [Alteromonas aestuariivivens]|uniref:MarR family transcriptional regulator n=1 Tax=Alteromonas aestuariivivens TaxID=1938339 RepID=A0A3D8MDB9_9ALTE|nr:MarR family transcriptional regulator [Alteromonas aestuariivivens]RDV28173.1 MarR family transcriptional regulator [Alteromonas aestuariivivens]